MKTHNYTPLEKSWTFSLRIFKQPVIFLLALLTCNSLVAQGPDFEWAKQMGGTNIDHVESIFVDDNGNVYSTGNFWGTADFDPGTGTSNLTPTGLYDGFVSKLDALGNFIWAKQMAGNLFCSGNKIQVDGTGNSYITGSFQGTVDFDPGAGTSSITSNGNSDIFVLKLDASGNFLWVKTIGGAIVDHGRHMQLDASGNIYISGSFEGTVDFDPGAGSFNLTANGTQEDIFVAKLDASGDFLWARQMGNTDFDEAEAIYVDQAGNVYATGAFTGTVDFDPGVGVSELISAGGTDVFVTKLDASGNFLWAKHMGGSDNDVGKAITVDDAGNVYTTGDFNGTGDFDPGTGTFNFTSGGFTDIFVSKLDASGDFVWAKNFGSTGLDRAYAITLDESGAVYSTGNYVGTVDFDPGTGTSNLVGVATYEVYISKLDSDGNFVWAKTVGGPNEDVGLDIQVDPSKNVYVAGIFRSTADFDPGPATTNLTGLGSNDIFILKLSCTPSFSTETVTACNSYVFNGMTYTSDNNTATDTLLNQQGCDSIITLDLTIEVIDLNVTSSADTLFSNATGVTYQWIDCENGNAIIPGATGSFYVAPANGNYAVILDNGLCSDTSECRIVFGVGLEEAIGASVRCYPNPTSDGVFTIEIDGIVQEIEIIDLLGRNLEVPIDVETGLVDGSTLISGKYMVHITLENGYQVVQQVVITK